MRLARVRLLARCNRVESARQWPQEAEKLVRRQLLGKRLEEIDQLAVGCELGERLLLHEFGHVGAARQLCIRLHQRPRQRRHIVTLAQLLQNHGLRTEPCRLSDLGGEVGIVLGQDADSVTRQIGEARRIGGELDVPSLPRRAGAIELDQGRDLGFERGLCGVERLIRVLILIRRLRRVLEVDVHHRRRRRRRYIGRGQLGERALRPLDGLLSEVEIEIDAVGRAGGAQRLEARIDRLAGRAELRIRRVAQREHREPDAIEPRRGVAHQSMIEISRSAWRFAFAPCRRIDNEVLRLGEEAHVGVRHVDDACIEAMLLCSLLRLDGEAFGVATFGGVEDRQRCPRPSRSRRHRLSALCRLEAREKTSEPAPLQRRRSRHDLVQNVNILRRERSVLGE